MKLCPTCSSGHQDSATSCQQCDSDLGPTTYRPGNELSGMVLQGKYVLRDFVEEGGMGWVYRGEHTAIGRDVAIKLMKPSGKLDGPGRTLRFEREARSTSRLSNPHIISVLDFGRTEGGLLYLVTEFVRGVTLSEELHKTGPLPFQRVLRIFSQIFAALDEAHRRHVVHRDLKPDNIMLTQFRPGEDFVKILDFGIATIALPSTQRLTRVGEVCGTPAYMAPEQISGKQVTAQADIYACGVMLYELLTNEVPLEGASIEETLINHLRAPPPLLRERLGDDHGLPDELDRIVGRAMAINVSERYHNVSEFRDALFRSATRGSWPAVQCSACHRAPDSPLGFCSDHCRKGVEQQEYYEEMVFEPPSEPVEPADPVVRPRQSSPGLKFSVADGLSTGDELDLDGDPGPLAREPSPTMASGERTARLHHDEDGFRTLPEGWLARDDQYQQIRGFLERGPGVLEIVGTPGTGKSTLLSEMAARARSLGRTVLATGQDPSLARRPWYAVQDLVRQSLGLPAGPLDLGLLRRRVLRAGLVASDVVPLALLLRPPGPERKVAPALLLREATGAVLRLLLGPRSSAAPCILVDDAGQLDGASLRFVRRLCLEIEGSGAKLAVASDRSLLAEGEQHTTIYLGPLEAQEVRALLLGRLSDDSRDIPALELTLAQSSSGLLLHLDQALRHLAEGGSDLSGPLDQLVERRLLRLPDGARLLLEALSTVGLRAPTALLQQMLGGDEELREHRTLLAEGGWTLPGSGPDLLSSHPAVLDAIRQTLSDEARRALHRKALAATNGDPTMTHVAARHAFEARAGEASLALQERAGDLAMGLSDPESAAMVHYRRALEVGRLELHLTDHDPRLLEIKLKLGFALRMAGHLLAAEVVLKETLAAAEQENTLRARILLELSRLDVVRDRHQEADRQLTEALRLAIMAGERELMVELYLELAGLLQSPDQQPRAIRELEEGILLVTSGAAIKDRPVVIGLWQLLKQLGELHQQQGRNAAALIALEQAVMQADGEGSIRARATCSLSLAQLLRNMGQAEMATQYVKQATAAFRRLGDRHNTARSLLLQAQLQPDQGGLPREALVLAREVRWHEGARQAEAFFG